MSYKALAPRPAYGSNISEPTKPPHLKKKPPPKIACETCRSRKTAVSSLFFGTSEVLGDPGADLTTLVLVRRQATVMYKVHQKAAALSLQLDWRAVEAASTGPTVCS